MHCRGLFHELRVVFGIRQRRHWFRGPAFPKPGGGGAHWPGSSAELARNLRQIEIEHGRPADATRFSARQLDIDILTYDDRVGLIDGVQLPRDEILENAFVLCPLAELSPDALHPVSGAAMPSLAGLRPVVAAAAQGGLSVARPGRVPSLARLFVAVAWPRADAPARR